VPCLVVLAVLWQARVRGSVANVIVCCVQRSVAILPDTGSQGLADTKTDADRDANDQKDDENLENDARPPAVGGHAVACAILAFVGLGLLPPVLLTGPYCAVGVG